MGEVGGFKMKKFMSLLLVMLLMFSLVACGSKTETPVAETPADTDVVTETPVVEESIEATISVQVESSWLEYYMAAADRVKAVHPNATINFIETGSFDHLDVLDSTDVTNEDVADVFALPADRIYGLSQNEALATIDATAMAANIGGFADYDAGLGGNFNVDGEYLAFPMNIETLINFANTANAEAAGVDLSQTMEFTEMSYETMLVPVFNAWFGVALTNSANIEMLGMKDDGTLFSDLTEDFANLAPEKQAAFTALFDYWKTHNDANTSLWDNSSAWGYMDTAFSSGGNNVIRLEGPWSTGSLSNLAGAGADLAILPINQVTLNGAPLTHWKGGWGLGVNARVEGNDDKMLLAQAMIEEIVNPEYAIDFFKATGKILENVDPSVYLNSDMSDTDKVVVEAVIESYQDAPARPLFTEWGSVWSTWKNGLLSWSAVKPATVEEAYAEVQASFKAMMLNF
jgi:arabinogalactan oligomer/maltooligosaccharide transport system substrate-binding protein